VAAKSDPTPSRYDLLKGGDSIENDFSNLIGDLLSAPFPDVGSDEQSGSSKTSYRPTPNFKPDKEGDRVGYGRLNN
jgi:hypothetical protein